MYYHILLWQILKKQEKTWRSLLNANYKILILNHPCHVEKTTTPQPNKKNIITNRYLVLFTNGLMQWHLVFEIILEADSLNLFYQRNGRERTCFYNNVYKMDLIRRSLDLNKRTISLNKCTRDMRWLLLLFHKQSCRNVSVYCRYRCLPRS